MKPYNRFYSVVITITTMIMYFLWKFIGSINTGNIIIVSVIGGLSAYGTYKIVYKIIGAIINSSDKIKKIALGKYYLDGIWVGVYLGVDNNPKYYIESYYQDFEKIAVSGRCYNTDYSYKGSWNSKDVILDKNKLIYNHATEMINNNFINIGESTFDILREDDRNNASKLIGYSKDLFSDKKFKSIEIKYCDGHKTKIKRNESDEQLLNKCAEVYQNHRDFFKD